MKILEKYNEFILEKLILEKLILESNIVYSDKFRKVLTRMPNNEIAKELLEIENKDLEVISNFFDVKADDDSMVTFTADRVAQEILNDPKEYVYYTGRRGGWLKNTGNVAIFARLGFEPNADSEEVYYPNRQEIGEIISKYESKKSGKTWCHVVFPGGKGVYDLTKLTSAVTPEDLKKKVFKTRRQEIRIGRIIRLILQANSITKPAAAIEVFVNEFRSILSILNDVFSRFEIVEGDDLGFWYNRNNYQDPHRGTLGTSCQAVGNLRWLEIYIDNPQTVKLLILKSEDTDSKIVGRALLWSLENGQKLVDRIYVTKDSDRNIFLEYAKQNEWNVIDVDRGTYVAFIKPGTYDQYPSIDNMHYNDPSTGKLSNNSFTGSHYLEWSENEDDEDWDDD
jgi:hypothetical protein